MKSDKFMNMKNILPFSLFFLLAAAGCAVIAGKNVPAPPARVQDVRFSFVESLRNTASLQGEGFKELVYATDPKTTLQQPNTVFADSFRVYATDTYTSLSVPFARIFVFDLGQRSATILDNTKTGSTVEGNLIAPAGIAVDAAGIIFVSDAQQGRVFGYDRNGRLVMTIGRMANLVHPAGLAVDNLRNILYVADTQTQRVRVFSTMGSYLSDVGGTGKASEDFKFPVAIALDSSGDLYVLDSLRLRVYIYDPDGKFIRAFGVSAGPSEGAVRPQGIAVDSMGHVYVADAFSNDILIFTPDGKPLLTWGGTGQLFGEFRSPAGIFIDSHDYIYIADKANGRIQVFQYTK